MNINKIFKFGNTSNSSVTHNISNGHVCDFQNSTITAFIDDKDKHRIIEACSIYSFNTIFQRPGIYQILPTFNKKDAKRFQNTLTIPDCFSEFLKL